ncbi:Tight junction-associated protein 1 [Eumeta japonica]|uniref:Tight junction-associated protein 1 n=1 Tax=Eumeta variegata TaxID=151549 RepID=A0A4C1YCC4_EUMVA|nr:Tight junction-associated protein 1 [Eumeta japonica]
MDENTSISPCKEGKDAGNELQLQGETEHLRQHLAERDAHIAALETEFLKSTVRVTDLEEELSTWKEKYERLNDSHKRVQRLNQVLEDKLLQMVDKMKSEKSQLTKDIATLSVRLAESKHNVSILQKENERYKNDMNLAIQLLQCKPDNFVSQKLDNSDKDILPFTEETLVIEHAHNDKKLLEDNMKLEANVQTNIVTKIDDNLKNINKPVNMEPTVHHNSCDRTSHSSAKGSNNSIINEPIKNVPHAKDIRPKNENVDMSDHHSIRKNSQSSMGAVSRTSSLTKSTSSTHKCNTQVGPGPRFCSLRMQAGSKNILLDNAQPDVPPVLYTRQSKCTENAIFKDLNESTTDNFINLHKFDSGIESNDRNENVVVESTLIDVHVDNNNKDVSSSSKTNSINPVLLNVSSSPLQPLKTHNYQTTSEKGSKMHDQKKRTASEVVSLLSDIDFSSREKNYKEEIKLEGPGVKSGQDTTPDCNGIKIFNFDRYEQNKLGVQLKPLRKVDMSQLHTIENTRISKDFPPQGEMPKFQKNISIMAKPTPSVPTVVNVYPNLTQTHLKVNESKKVFTNEQSTSSLSSDDSAALLQKQQLLRVAEWVEQNLEQHNNLNDPTVLEEDINFNKSARRESKPNRVNENLDNALKMPHPVSKYSNSFTRDEDPSWILKNIPQKKTDQQVNNTNAKFNVAKETIFPVDSEDTTSVIEVVNLNDENVNNNNLMVDLGHEKEISAEEFARMEYNVKKFLLSGPHWVNPEAVCRTRRTSSKTETDV